MAKFVKRIHSKDGMKIYADAVGNSENPALVFVHGFSGSAASFDQIFSKSESSKEFFLVRYDLRGQGRSGKPGAQEGYASQRCAEDFEAVCKAFGVKKTIVVGWSMGAKILTDIATFLASDTLLGAVSISGAPYFDKEMEGLTTRASYSIGPGVVTTNNSIVQHQATIASIRLLFLRDPNPNADFLAETVKAFGEGTGFVQENPDVPWETRCEFIGTSMHTPARDRVYIASRPQDNTRVLELLNGKFSLFVIYGTHGAYISGEKTVDLIRPEAPDLKARTIDGASHTPFVEKPDEVIDAIVEFANALTK